MSTPKTWLAATAGLFLAASLTACGANEPEGGGDEGSEGGGGSTIALLLPESKTTRYEAFDRPLVRDRKIGMAPRGSWMTRSVMKVVATTVGSKTDCIVAFYHRRPAGVRARLRA